jgi:act minimal PKS chain-length factor (CLF/KS beta)
VSTATLPHRKAVVTGLSAVAPNGLGTEAYWSATLAGESGIRRISRFEPASYPSRLAGEVPGFDPADHLPSRLIPQTDRMTQLALAAANWALEDSGADLAAIPDFERGVVTAAAAGGFEFGHRELQNLWSQGPEFVSAYQSFAWFYAVNTGQISIRHGLCGPGAVLVAEQAGGLDAVAHARRQIRQGIRLVVTGGVDGSICPWGWVMQQANGRLSTRNLADRAYLPFDRDAAGYVPGEGGAIMVLEDAESAAARDAHVYGEIAGYAATFDPRPGSGRPPGLRRAIEMALADAGIEAAEVDVVFADGAGSPDLDWIEIEALTAVFGPHGVPVTVPKTMTGRLYSGGAPLDLTAALLAIQDGVIPPTCHVTHPDEALDLVLDEPRPTFLRTALVVARGDGGFNSAMVVRKA